MLLCPDPVLPCSLFIGKISFKVLPKTFCGELRGKISLFYVLYGPEQSDYRNIKKVEKG